MQGGTRQEGPTSETVVENLSILKQERVSGWQWGIREVRHLGVAVGPQRGGTPWSVSGRVLGCHWATKCLETGVRKGWPKYQWTL